MSFFSFSLSTKSRWLFIAIGLGLTAIISTSAIGYVKTSSQAKNAVDKGQSIPSTLIVDKVFVDKSERILKLLSKDTVVKSYRIALGDSPIGHKQQQGDQRTPVGYYTLDYKNENSIAHRSIHVSYPNAADKARAKSRGVNPGGDIMIHGQMNGFGHLAGLNQQRDWTDGCIAVTNDEMDEIMAAVKVGTAIEIVE
ncbi:MULTISPECIES: L,D-transpeptidase family protein [Psychrobacter]|uniref:L,D-transpeptidase family protein n=2 Tax=Gammaproteobacteria TaxID=1236 RepID=UPI0015636777|nr:MULTISPECIES: L,D-transpeptidase family protein [Psychrobacter]NRD70321.1 L,D-transpeptidase family protein [Psychrobacter okhotskensis]